MPPTVPLPRLHQSELTFGLLMMFLSVVLSPIIDIFSKLAAITIPPAEVPPLLYSLARARFDSKPVSDTSESTFAL